MRADGDIRLSPAWKHALRVLLDRGIKDGDILTKVELCEIMGLKRPQSIEEFERFQFDFMSQFGALRDELLEEHRLALRTMYGEASYQVVPPAEQTELAVTDGLKEMRRAARKMARTLAFVRHEALTDAQRKQNADAQAKAAMLAGMIRNPQLPK